MKKLLVPLCAAALFAATVPHAEWRRASRRTTSRSTAGEVTTLNYMITGSENAHIMFANTIDNLVEYDQHGILRPSLALSWEPSKDGLTWTFKLRPGVKWLTADGKEYAEVTAQDWVDSAKYILTKANASETADVLTGVLKNSDKFFKGELTDFAAGGRQGQGQVHPGIHPRAERALLPLHAHLRLLHARQRQVPGRGRARSSAPATSTSSSTAPT